MPGGCVARRLLSLIRKVNCAMYREMCPLCEAWKEGKREQAVKEKGTAA